MKGAESIKRVEIVKKGLFIDGKEIPLGTIFSKIDLGMEVCDENGSPLRVFQSLSWDDKRFLFIGVIELVVNIKTGEMKAYEEEIGMESDFAEEFVYPEVVNLSPTPGKEAFF